MKLEDVFLLILIILFVIILAWRESVSQKWKHRAFICLKYYQEVCLEHNIEPKYIP